MQGQRKFNNKFIQPNNNNRLSQLFPRSNFTQQLKSLQQLNEQFRSQLQLQYYRTMELIYKTQNFNKQIILANSTQINRSQKQPQYEAIYLPQVSLIGNIVQLKKTKITCKKSDEEGQNTQDNPQMMKVIYLTTYDKQQKSILIKTSEYKANLSKHFNRIMRPKNKNQKFIITNLQPVYYRRLTKPKTLEQQQQDNKIYFILQYHSTMVQIFQQFYNIHFRPIQRILDQDFRFSHIKLAIIFTIDELDKNCKDGFMISQIKNRFQTRHHNTNKKQNNIIVGLVNIVDSYQQYQNNNNRNKKQIVLWITQILFRPEYPQRSYEQQARQQQKLVKCQEIGRCKLIIKYFQQDAEYMQNLIINNHVYAIADAQPIITENLNILYHLNIPKNNAKNCCIIRVSQQPYEGFNFGCEYLKNVSNPFSIQQIEQLFSIHLQTVKVNKFLQKCINRNLVKLQLGLLQVQVIYGSIRCSKCGYQIKKNADLDQILQFEDNEYQFQKLKNQMGLNQQQLKKLKCRKLHKEHHCLHLWGSVRAADDTGTCILSMQHKELMKFLEIQNQYQQIEKYVVKNGKGLVIMNSNREKNKPQDDPLFKVKNRIRKRYIEKPIVGYARTQLDKTFRESLTEQEQLDFQVSFQNSKKYIQHKKIFPNGIIQKRTQQMLLLPYIKVLQVLQPQW